MKLVESLLQLEILPLNFNAKTSIESHLLKHSLIPKNKLTLKVLCINLFKQPECTTTKTLVIQNVQMQKMCYQRIFQMDLPVRESF